MAFQMHVLCGFCWKHFIYLFQCHLLMVSFLTFPQAALNVLIIWRVIYRHIMLYTVCYKPSAHVRGLVKARPTEWSVCLELTVCKGLSVDEVSSFTIDASSYSVVYHVCSMQRLCMCWPQTNPIILPHVNNNSTLIGSVHLCLALCTVVLQDVNNLANLPKKATEETLLVSTAVQSSIKQPPWLLLLSAQTTLLCLFN